MRTTIKTILSITFAFSLNILLGQGFVKTQGNLVLDTNNVPILLNGVNLGGWLVQENWMCGITDSTDLNYGRNQLATLESRFDDTQVTELMNTWQQNWIKEVDFQFLSNKGFNFVRVPFGYRNLQDKYLNWKLKPNGEIDFDIFDTIVNWAEQNELYVLFDYHIWLNQNIQYNSISDNDTTIDHTILIWQEFADHFKNNKTVLGYDVLNEPTGSWNNNVIDEIYDSIRAIDQNHLISLEWVDPDTIRWQNVLYQSHFYDLYHNDLASNINTFDSIYVPIFEMHNDFNVPFYVGETHCFSSDSTWEWSLNEYCQRLIHWSPWTYKTVNMWGWGLINVDNNSVKVNLNVDDFATIKSKWLQLSNSQNLFYMNNLIDIWSNATECSVLSLETVNKDKIKFYYEPNSNILYLQEPFSFNIMNMAGQIVFNNTTDSVQFSLDKLEPGIYFLNNEFKQLGKMTIYN